MIPPYDLLHPRAQRRPSPPPTRLALTNALTTLCLLIAPLASIAHAYVPSTTNTSHKPLAWTESSCIFLQVNSNGSDDIHDGSDVAAVHRAVTRWHEALSCTYLRFNLLADSPTAKASFDNKRDNINTVSWVEAGWKTELDHDPAAAGLTTLFFVDDPESPRDGKILDADVELNGEFFTFSAKLTGVPGKTDIENTVVHELGHVMGLDHPCDDGLRNPVPKDNNGETIPKCFPLGSLPQAMRDVTMFNFADPGETKKRTPEADDIQGICQTYPLNANPGQCNPMGVSGDGSCALSPVSSSHPPFLLLISLLFASLLLRRRRHPRHRRHHRVL